MATKQGALLEALGAWLDVFVELEELCWVPRHLSKLEVRRLRTLWMDRKNCVTGW